MRCSRLRCFSQSSSLEIAVDSLPVDSCAYSNNRGQPAAAQMQSVHVQGGWGTSAELQGSTFRQAACASGPIHSRLHLPTAWH